MALHSRWSTCLCMYCWRTCRIPSLSEVLRYFLGAIRFHSARKIIFSNSVSYSSTNARLNSIGRFRTKDLDSANQAMIDSKGREQPFLIAVTKCFSFCH